MTEFLGMVFVGVGEVLLIAFSVAMLTGGSR